VAGRDGERGSGDGAARPQSAAADRRRHHVKAAHCRPNRARVLGPDGSCGGCLPGGRRRFQPARRGAPCGAGQREPRAAGATARSARGQGDEDVADPGCCARKPRQAGVRRPGSALLHRPPPGRRGSEPPLAVLGGYIDCPFSFHAWALRGRFPGILSHSELGPAARELYENAQTLLDEIVANGWLRARGVFGFWPARACGDDLVLDNGVRFPMLRQQVDHGDDRPNLSLADFVSAAGDHLGAVPVTAGVGAEELARRFEADHDDYRAIMVKALADRLAEAFAEYLHEMARREWYERGPRLTNRDLIAEKYRGIRPASGYPACPDHTDKRTLFDLLGARQLGLELTQTCAITPP